MSIYTFSNKDSAIDRVTIRRTSGGGTRAYIHAREGVDPQTLENVKTLLTKKGLAWTPIQEDLIPALEVRGIGKDESKFLQLLDDSDAITGSLKKQTTTDDKSSFKDKLKRNTLKASGYSYFIGDAGFLAYGYGEFKKAVAKQVRENGKSSPTAYLDLAAGIFYAMGTPFIAFFGRGDKSDIQIRHMSYNMINDLEKEKLDVPKDAAVRAIANGHNKTAFKKFKTFCYRYPAEITNGLFAVAGSLILSSGVVKYKELMHDIKRADTKILKETLKKDRPHLIMDMGLGAMTITAGLISVFVEEEARKKDEPKKKGLAGVWDFIKEKPLRAAGIALGLSTVSHAGSTVMAYSNANKILKNPPAYPSELELGQIADAKRNKTALPGRAVFVATNLTAEILMALSSKGHGAGVISDKSLDNSAYAVAADLIHRTHAEKRPQMLDSLANFLADKKHLSRDKSEVLDGINTQLQVIESNPWAVLPGQKKIRNEQTATSAESQDYWQKKTAIPSPAVINASKNHRDTVEASRENLSTLIKS